jgi:hypothetical protein
MTETLNELKTLYKDKTLCNRIKTELYFRIIETKKTNRIAKCSKQGRRN